MMDNATSVACVNEIGTSHSDICHSVTKQMWEFCIARNLWISAAYVPGVENTAADEESRKENLDTEWKLNPDILAQAQDIIEVHSFASRINTQFPRYVILRPNPTS